MRDGLGKGLAFFNLPLVPKKEAPWFLISLSRCGAQGEEELRLKIASNKTFLKMDYSHNKSQHLRFYST